MYLRTYGNCNDCAAGRIEPVVIRVTWHLLPLKNGAVRPSGFGAILRRRQVLTVPSVVALWQLN